VTTTPEQQAAEQAATEERAAPEEQAAPAVSPDEKPQPAEGIELIGEYEGSGFKEPPYIARRADGQTVQMPKLLYLIAEEADGGTTLAQIAERVTEKFGRGLDAESVGFLVEKQLRPLGVIAGADGSSPQLQKVDPLLALKFRTGVVPERVVRAITTFFYPLFFPPVVLAVLAGLVALDVWLFAVHGVAQSMRDLVYNPILLFMVLGLVVLSAMLHECGHATACRYGGATPGKMGIGIYIVWPALYTDVTDAYRLGKGGRLRTDFGGVYFNVIFSLATFGAYFLTGYEPLLVVVVLQHIEIVHQFLPFLRLDGYYVLSDLTGVPDMFTRIRPTLASLIPWKKTDERVTELKPWARFTVMGWVLLLIPIILFMFGTMVFNAPRIFATAYDSFVVQYHRVGDAFGGGRTLSGVAGIVQITALALPSAGMVASFGRVGKRSLVGAWAWSAGSVVRRGVVLAGATGAAGFLGFVWYPNGDYTPIQPGEKGTIQGAVHQISQVATGRPGLSPQRARQLGRTTELRNQTQPVVPNPTQTGPTSTTTPTSTTGGSGSGTPTPTSSTATTPTSTTETTPTTTETTTTTP
jgi:putative peptide zinc metalloprotease protein